MSQWHCMVQGQQYGPVDDSTIREWIRAGRLQPNDNVWTEGMAEWQPAAEVPALAGSFADAYQQAPATSHHPPSEANVADVYNQSPPQTPAGYTQPTMPSKPHRGGLLLTLAIVSVVLCCCGPLGVVTMILAKMDLKEMDAGTRDPSGRGTTNAAFIIGLIVTILFAINITLRLFGVVEYNYNFDY